MGHQFPSEFYTKTNWKNEPDTSTPLGQANLNHIEQGIKTADERIYNLDGRIGVYEDYETEISAQVQQAKDYSEASEDSATDSANSASASSQSASASALSASSASASATSASQSASSASTSETNASQSEANALTSEQNAKASEDNAKESEENAETYQNNALVYRDLAYGYKNEAQSADLSASQSALNASTSETNASASATLSQSYAVGGTNTRTGEDTDNAKYYKEQAQHIVDDFDASDVDFDNTGTSSSATNVQDALTEALSATVPTASDVTYDNTTSGLSSTNVQDAIDEVNSKPMPSYIGMLDISTVNDTLEKVQAIYGSNTTWIQHSGYVLRGATSGVTSNDATKTGGADSVEHSHTIAHTHTMAHTHTIAHTHTMAHTHTIAHTHTYAHTHGVPAHSHTLSSKGWAMITTGWYSALWTAMKTKTGLSWKSNQQGTGGTGGKNQGAETKSEGAALDGATDSHAAMTTNSQSASTTSASSAANSGAASNATTSASSAANSGAASNSTTSDSSAANSGSTTINILPSYKSVYIWERTA